MCNIQKCFKIIALYHNLYYLHALMLRKEVVIYNENIIKMPHNYLAKMHKIYLFVCFLYPRKSPCQFKDWDKGCS